MFVSLSVAHVMCAMSLFGRSRDLLGGGSRLDSITRNLNTSSPTRDSDVQVRSKWISHPALFPIHKPYFQKQIKFFIKTTDYDVIM